MEAGNEGLRVGRKVELSFGPLEQGTKASSFEILGYCCSQQVQTGGGNIDDPHHLANPPTGIGPGVTHKERYAERGFIEEEHVCLLTVLAERLAVVRGENDDRLVGKPALVEPIQ